MTNKALQAARDAGFDTYRSAGGACNQDSIVDATIEAAVKAALEVYVGRIWLWLEGSYDD